jgi:DHA1 family tetracycline resistance protein-like MFS transporter
MRKHRLAIIFMVVLVDMLSFSIVLPLLPYLARDLNATPFQIGLLSAIYPLAQLIGAPLLGRLSDRVGRKPVLLVSIAGTVAGFVVLATASSLWVLFVSRFVDGITGGNISVAQAYITDVTKPEERGKALGLIGAAFGMGFILGPITGGLLSGISYAAPAWAGALLATLNIVLVATMLPESLSAEQRAVVASEPRRGFDPHALQRALKHPRVGPLLWIRFATGIAYSIFESGFALWAIAALGLTARTNSFVLAYVGVLSVLVQLFLIGRLTGRFDDDHLLLWSLCIAAAALAVWGFAPNIPVLVILMPFLSVGLAVSNTIMTSALTKAVTHDEVGGILGLNTSIQSFTRIPAPIIAGGLIQYATVWAPGLVAGVLTGGMALFAQRKLCLEPGRGACVEDEDVLRDEGAVGLPPEPVAPPAASGSD